MSANAGTSTEDGPGDGRKLEIWCLKKELVP